MAEAQLGELGESRHEGDVRQVAAHDLQMGEIRQQADLLHALDVAVVQDQGLKVRAVADQVAHLLGGDRPAGPAAGPDLHLGLAHLDGGAAEAELRHGGVRRGPLLCGHDLDLVVRGDDGLPPGAVDAHLVGPILGGQGVDGVGPGLPGLRPEGQEGVGHLLNVAVGDAEILDPPGDADAQVRGLDVPEGDGPGDEARRRGQLVGPALLHQGRAEMEGHVAPAEHVGRRPILLQIHRGEGAEGRFHVGEGPADHGALRGLEKGGLGVLDRRAGEQAPAQRQHQQQGSDLLHRSFPPYSIYTDDIPALSLLSREERPPPPI